MAARKKKGARRRLPSRKGTLKRLEKAMNALAKKTTGISFTEARKARKPRGGTSGRGRAFAKSARKSRKGSKNLSKAFAGTWSTYKGGRKRDKKGRFVKSRKR